MIKNRKPIALSFLAAIILSAAILASGPAQARPKAWFFGWPRSHWHDQDFAPYMEQAKPPHNTQWRADEWKPEDWVAQRGQDSVLLHGFYQAEIIHDQYLSRFGMPVLEVGPGFYRLGGEDKRRVAETLDKIYNVTANHPSGMYMLHDWRTEKPVGAYTKTGLQLQ